MNCYTIKSNCLISVGDVARILNTDRTTVDRLITSGELKDFDFCGVSYILPKDLASYISDNEAACEEADSPPKHRPTYVEVLELPDVTIYQFVYDLGGYVDEFQGLS